MGHGVCRIKWLERSVLTDYRTWSTERRSWSIGCQVGERTIQNEVENIKREARGLEGRASSLESVMLRRDSI